VVRFFLLLVVTGVLSIQRIFAATLEQTLALHVSGTVARGLQKNAYDVGNVDRSYRAADHIDNRRL
jgi:hypothetical protein